MSELRERSTKKLAELKAYLDKKVVEDEEEIRIVNGSSSLIRPRPTGQSAKAVACEELWRRYSSQRDQERCPLDISEDVREDYRHLRSTYLPRLATSSAALEIALHSRGVIYPVCRLKVISQRHRRTCF